MSLTQLLTRPPVAERDGVLDFLSDGEDAYRNFGIQWQRFRRVQLDSLNGAADSRDRFFAETGWNPGALTGKLLLDAGCGAGRFAEVALEAGARVVAVDASEAVWACRRTLQRFSADRYLVLRADIFDLPFEMGCFDGIYSLGVLQHTPDPLGAIPVLRRFLRPGACLATWIYERRRPDLSKLQPRTWLRAVSADWSQPAKLRLAQLLTGLCFPLGWLLSWFGRNGERLSQFLPYAARHHLARRSWRGQWEYCILDTYDWYGPKYDQPQSEDEVRRAMQHAGLVDVRRLPARGMAIVGAAPEP
ncbi:MAG: class I SAM-dependent methyltransferase [Terriglobales bacterium]